MSKVVALESDVIHRICTNQVIVDLGGAMKELVENSIDAGATKIDIRLQDQGATLLQVTDNGSGIARKNFASVAQRHATSKIKDFTEIHNSLSTYGFRGEALSAICAMSSFSFTTRTKEEDSATTVHYNKMGTVESEEVAAREVGTTVTVKDLFKNIPIRHREFLRTIKNQLSHALKLLQQFAIRQFHVRFHMVSEKGGSRCTLLSTPGTHTSLLDSAKGVLGSAVDSPIHLDLDIDGKKLNGFMSHAGSGRRSKDMQFFYVNGRPAEPPKKVAKVINDVYRQFNSRSYPMFVLNYEASQSSVDVNVTPDKRTILLDHEARVADALKDFMMTSFSGSVGLVPVPAPAPANIASVVPIAAQCAKSDESAEDEQIVPAPVPVSGVSVIPFAPSAIRKGTSSSSERQSRDSIPGVSVTSFAPKSQDAAATPGVSVVSFAPASEEDTAAIPVVSVNTFAPASEEDTAAIPVVSVTSFAPTPQKESAIPGVSVVSVAPTPQKETSATPGVSVSASTTNTAQIPGVSVLSFTPASSSTSPAPVTTQPHLQQSSASQGDTAEADMPALISDDGELDPEKPRSAPVLVRKRPVDSVVSLDLGARKRSKRANEDRTASGEKNTEVPAGEKKTELPAGEKKTELPAGDLSKLTIGAELLSEADMNQIQLDKSMFDRMVIHGQFNLGFIIASVDQHFFIIDQHASDEKRRFELLNKTSIIDQQPLITPLKLELSPAQENVVTTYPEVFRANGFNIDFDFDKPPGQRVRVKAWPTSKNFIFSQKDIDDLISAIQESGYQGPDEDEAKDSDKTPETKTPKTTKLLDIAGHRSCSFWGATSAIPRPQKVWSLLASRACRSAVMIGTPMRTPAMENLIRALGELEQPWNCPHGRPTLRYLCDAGQVKRVGKQETVF